MSESERAKTNHKWTNLLTSYPFPYIPEFSYHWPCTLRVSIFTVSYLSCWLVHYLTNLFLLPSPVFYVGLFLKELPTENNVAKEMNCKDKCVRRGRWMWVKWTLPRLAHFITFVSLPLVSIINNMSEPIVMLVVSYYSLTDPFYLMSHVVIMKRLDLRDPTNRSGTLDF